MKNLRISLLLQYVFFIIAIGLFSCDKEEDQVEDIRILLEEEELNVGELEIYRTVSSSNYSFTSLQIQMDVDWISYETNSNLLHFTFLPNHTNEKRTTNITFLKDDEVIDELLVNQEVFGLEYPEGALTLDDIDYTINSTIDNMPVTSECLTIYGFSESYNLDEAGATEIIIPPYYFVEGRLRMVGSINHDAFKENGLTKVVLPQFIYSIHDHAFSGNHLTEINLGIRLNYIDWEAFADNKLVEINIPNSVKRIGYEAFSNNLLEKVTIGSSVTEIGESAFQLNENLCEVINNSEIELTQEMFPKCPVGQCDIVSDYVFGFNSDLSYDETFVVDYTGISTEAYIPNSVKEVGTAAFYDKSLTSVTFSPFLKVIEGSAFNSNKIQSVSFNANIEVIGTYAFANNEIQQVNFDDNSMLKRIGIYAFYGCSSSSVVLPSNANTDFHHYEDSDGNIVTEIIKDNYGYPGTTYYACKEDGTRIE